MKICFGQKLYGAKGSHNGDLDFDHVRVNCKDREILQPNMISTINSTASAVLIKKCLMKLGLRYL